MKRLTNLRIKAIALSVACLTWVLAAEAPAELVLSFSDNGTDMSIDVSGAFDVGGLTPAFDTVSAQSLFTNSGTLRFSDRAGPDNSDVPVDFYFLTGVMTAPLPNTLFPTVDLSSNVGTGLTSPLAVSASTSTLQLPLFYAGGSITETATLPGITLASAGLPATFDYVMTYAATGGFAGDTVRWTTTAVGVPDPVVTGHVLGGLLAPPTAIDGEDGDFYLDAMEGDLYGPKIEGEWLEETLSLIGPAGADGADGQDGAPGADGADGAPGAPGVDGEDGAPGADGEDGAPGADGADGATGATGPQGPQGDTGPGLIQGSILFLLQGTPAPAGFTKIGTIKQLIKDLSGKPKNHTLDVYQMD